MVTRSLIDVYLNTLIRLILYTKDVSVTLAIDNKDWQISLLANIKGMNVSLTPTLEKAVKEKVESGLYNNASEVIREALRITLRQEQENDWLKREAAIGYAQLEAGEVISVNSKDEFKNLVRGQTK